MNELTIKHLAAYLPYGLKCKIEVFGDNEAIVGLEGLIHNEVELSWQSSMLSLTNNEIKQTITNYFKYNDIKPILYPLDFLTKEITHNGETFVPIERLFEFDYPANKSKKYYYDNQTNYIRCSHENTTYHKMIYTNNELFGGNFFKDVEKLLEWKFDIFNLIENDLAIAVTEDFNPYK